MMDHQAREREIDTKKNQRMCVVKKKRDKKEKKKSIRKVPQTHTHTSVWLIEEDLRARLPVLFEGTKYE